MRRNKEELGNYDSMTEALANTINNMYDRKIEKNLDKGLNYNHDRHLFTPKLLYYFILSNIVFVLLRIAINVTVEFGVSSLLVKSENMFLLAILTQYNRTYLSLVKILFRPLINMLHMFRLLQYIPKNMHTVFALLCFVVAIHWLIFPYPSGLLHWHCGNLTIAPVPAKQPWWIWINTSCEFIMNDCVTTTKQSTTKPCAYFLGYTV